MHPLETSYNAALRDRVLATFDDLRSTAVCYRLASEEHPTDRDLQAAERLVLVYPTWSGGLPAMLLDWAHGVLDRPGLLRGVRELVAVTSCGSSRWVNLVQGEWGRDFCRHQLLDACAPGARFRWLPLYKVDRRSDEEMERHLDHVEQRLRAWFAGGAQASAPGVGG